MSSRASPGNLASKPHPVLVAAKKAKECIPYPAVTHASHNSRLRFVPSPVSPDSIQALTGQGRQNLATHRGGVSQLYILLALPQHHCGDRKVLCPIQSCQTHTKYLSWQGCDYTTKHHKSNHSTFLDSSPTRSRSFSNTRQITQLQICRPAPLDAASAGPSSSSAPAALTATTLSAATASDGGHDISSIGSEALGFSIHMTTFPRQNSGHWVFQFT